MRILQHVQRCGFNSTFLAHIEILGIILAKSTPGPLRLCNPGTGICWQRVQQSSMLTGSDTSHHTATGTLSAARGVWPDGKICLALGYSRKGTCTYEMEVPVSKTAQQRHRVPKWNIGSKESSAWRTTHGHDSQTPWRKGFTNQIDVILKSPFNWP